MSGQRVGSLRVGRLIGEGGFAQVYAAEGDGGPCVLKVGRTRGGRRGATYAWGDEHAQALAEGRPQTVGPSQVDAWLLDEAARLERIDGAAGFPRLLERLEHDGRPALALERVAGQDLVAVRRAGRPLPLRALSALARGLSAAIHAGALPAHGDLKPANLLLTDDGALRPLDPPPLPHEGTRSLLATPGFDPYLRCDPAADVRALTGCLYAHAAGRSSPYGAEAAPARAAADPLVRRAFLAIHYTPLREVRPDLPHDLSALVDEVLEAAPPAASGGDCLEAWAERLDALGVEAIAPPPGARLGPLLPPEVPPASDPGVRPEIKGGPLRP